LRQKRGVNALYRRLTRLSIDKLYSSDASVLTVYIGGLNAAIRRSSLDSTAVTNPESSQCRPRGAEQANPSRIQPSQRCSDLRSPDASGIIHSEVGDLPPLPALALAYQDSPADRKIYLTLVAAYLLDVTDRISEKKGCFDV